MADAWDSFVAGSVSAAAPKPVDANADPRPAVFKAISHGGDAIVHAGQAPLVGLGSKILDLLDRPGAAIQAKIAGHDPWDAFAHGVSREERGANRAVLREKIGLNDPNSLLGRSGTYKDAPHAGRGVVDAALDFFTDPVSLLGGSGLLEKGANIGGKAALFGTVKGANAAQRKALDLSEKIPAKLADPAKVEGAIKGAGQVTAAAFDALGPRNRVTRKAITQAPFTPTWNPKQAAAQISQPFTDVDRVTAMKSRAVNTQRGVTHAGQKAYDDAMKGLSEADQHAVFQAIDKGTIAKLSPELQKPAETVRDLYRGLLHLQGARTVRKDLAAQGFQLPEALKPFDGKVRGIFTRGNVRANYLPHGGEFSGADKAAIEAESRLPGIDEQDLLGPQATSSAPRAGSALDANDPSRKARVDTSQLQDTGRQDAINRARFASAGRSIAGRDASRELAQTFARPRPVTRSLPGEKPDVGEVYRAATSGLNPEEKRIVNMLQQGAKREDVAARVYGPARAAKPTPVLRRVESDVSAQYEPEFQQYTNRVGPVKRYTYYRGDQPVGHVEVSFPASGTPHVEDILTHAGQRRQGVGEAMLRDASDTVRALGHSKVTASPMNETASALNKRVWGEPESSGVTLNGSAIDDIGVNDLHSLAPRPRDVAPAAGTIPQHLIDRAQTVIDAVNYFPESKTVATGAVTHSLSDVPRHLREYFQRDALPSGSAVSKALGAAKAAADAPKYGFFFNWLRHGGNVTQLAALADPGAALAGMSRYALAHPHTTGGFAGAAVGYDQGGVPGALAGAAAGTGLGLAVGRTPFSAAARASQGRAVDAARKAGAIPANVDSDIPGFINAIPGLRNVYGASNKALWGYDEAQKATRFDALIKSGVHPDVAAARVGEDLLDYGNKSALTKAMNYAAPFASYRTKMPGAVLRSIARHPERAQTASRTMPALVGPDQEADDNGATLRNYLPLAEVLRGLDSPEEYTRATLSYPYKDLLSLGKAGRFPFGAVQPEADQGTSAGRTNREAHFYTGGYPVHKVLPSQLVGPLPGGDEMLTLLGLNPYNRAAQNKTFQQRLDDLLHGITLDDFMRAQVEGSTATRVRAP